jgi:hypothetical protein
MYRCLEASLALCVKVFVLRAYHTLQSCREGLNAPLQYSYNRGGSLDNVEVRRKQEVLFKFEGSLTHRDYSSCAMPKTECTLSCHLLMFTC